MKDVTSSGVFIINPRTQPPVGSHYPIECQQRFCRSLTSSAAAIRPVSESGNQIRRESNVGLLGERLAFDQFENEEPRVVLFLQIVDSGDVRVVQCSKNFGLAME